MFMLEETLRNEMMENKRIGKEEMKIQIIKRMNKLGFDSKQIAEIMKMSKNEINEILNKEKIDKEKKN